MSDQSKAMTEPLWRVWTEGRFLEVGDFEVPDYVELRSVGEKNEEWFGRIRVSMTPEFAEQLGNALIAAANAKKAA